MLPIKKIINSIVAVIIIVTLVTACSEDFLNIDPINKLSADDFWKTDEDANMALLGVYDILQWMYARDWNSAYLAKTLPSDESNAGGGNSGDQPPYQELNTFSYSSGNPVIAAVFESNYYGVYRANMVINKVEPVNAARERVIAEAKCLRAYFYFELVSMFGGVPLILHELEISEYAQPRATVSGIYDQIEADLRQAIEALPNKSEYSANDKFRVSKGTAQTLLGKAYLYQEVWDSAAYFLNEVIAVEGVEYDLDSNFATLFFKESELGIESIFEVMYSTEGGYEWSTFQWSGNRQMENNVHIQLMGPRGDDFIADSTNTFNFIGGWGFNYPTDALYQAYIAANDSVRRKATILTVAELEDNGGGWKNPSGWGFEGYFRLKYGTWKGETVTNHQPELNYGTNQRLLRYADVLLMAAEAYYRLSDENRARTELNKVRFRAGLSDVSATGADLFDAIVLERELELAFEGVRFLDLIRWGLAEDVLGDAGFETNKHELFPIPLNEMNNNPLITEQNNGY